MGEIKFDEELHGVGERCPVANMQLSQALAWWIASELVRRHPGELRVIETHPGGGQYNCVSVYRVTDGREPEVVVHMNIDPGAHLTHGSWFSADGDGERFNWLAVLLCENRRSYVVEQLERSERLSAPSKTPSTESSTVGPLVIAAFLERSAFGPASWDVVNGMADSSYGLGVRSELFEQFPGAAEWASRVEGEFDGNREYRFWFVGPTGPAGLFGLTEASFVVDTWTGHLWRRNKPERLDLLASYIAAGRSLDALVSTVCPPAF